MGISIFLFCLLILVVLSIFQWTHWSGGWLAFGEGMAIGSGVMLISALWFICQMIWQMNQRDKTNKEK